MVRLTRHNYQKLPCLLSLIPVVLLLYVHICGFYAFLLRFSCNYTHKYYIILSPLRWLFLHALPVTKVVVALVFHGLTLLSHFWLACGGQRIHWSSFVWVENCSPESYCFPAWQKNWFLFSFISFLLLRLLPHQWYYIFTTSHSLLSYVSRAIVSFVHIPLHSWTLLLFLCTFSCYIHWKNPDI